MKVKITRSHRKNKELESIKRELQEINEKIQATTTVKMDADQMEFFLNELTERIEWSTNRIVDESKEKIMISPPLSQERKDGFSYLIKIILGSLFISFGAALGYILIAKLGYYWGQGWGEKLGMIIFYAIAFDCIILGIDIFREQDRNYLVAMFSALVALVALIVTLMGNS